MPVMPATDPIYLDHNATTPLLPEVVEAMARAARDGFANPASQHAAGRAARRLVEESRERIAELLGLDATPGRGDSLFFTSGGTEANNWALHGLLHYEGCESSHLLISPVEHPSILGPAELLEQSDVRVERLPVDRTGRVMPSDLADRLRPDTQLVSVMLGNNETGVIQPIAELADICRSRDVWMHCDAVQGVGKIPVNFRALGVDAMSVAAHKFHGPRGIGALAVRQGVKLSPLLVGGFQQQGLRPGTESPALCVGMRAALEAFHREGAERTRRLAALRDRLEGAIVAIAPSAIVVHAREVERLPQTLNVAFLGLDRQAMFMSLDQAGVACSTGSACASGSSEPSPTLVAMGCSPAEFSSSLRFSVGATTTIDEVDETARRIRVVYNDLRGAAERRKSTSSGR